MGEALVSVLEGNGSPGVVERVLIAPPASRVGPADLGERTALLRVSPMAGRYDQPIDRFSAYEHLKQRSAPAAAEDAAGSPRPTAPAPGSRRRGRSVTEDVVGALASSAARSIGSRLGRELVRGVLGSLLRR